MATLDDLFGSKSGSFGPKFVNLKNTGEWIKGVITRIDVDAPVQEMVRGADGKYKPGNKKYWVDGKPKGVPEDEAERAGLRPVTQIELHLTDVVGQWSGKADDVTEARISVTSSATERAAFKAAVADTGSIDDGDGFGKKLIERDGNTKNWEMKVIPKA